MNLKETLDVVHARALERALMTRTSCAVRYAQCNYEKSAQVICKIKSFWWDSGDLSAFLKLLSPNYQYSVQAKTVPLYKIAFSSVSWLPRNANNSSIFSFSKQHFLKLPFWPREWDPHQGDAKVYMKCQFHVCLVSFIIVLGSIFYTCQKSSNTYVSCDAIFSGGSNVQWSRLLQI